MMLDYKLCVVTITNSIENYPQFTEETKEFPGLVEYIDDEVEIFVVVDNNPEIFWYAHDFFNMVSIKSFLVDREELVS